MPVLTTSTRAAKSSDRFSATSIISGWRRGNVPTTPSDRKVYDTISRIRYLTAMVKDHYGSYNLGTYIYKGNERFIGHSDRIRPGTQVVIPDLKKYGVDPQRRADIDKAKKLGVEIYARYR